MPSIYALEKSESRKVVKLCYYRNFFDDVEKSALKFFFPNKVLGSNQNNQKLVQTVLKRSKFQDGHDLF